MSANRRVWYATHVVSLAPLSTTAYTTTHGVQSVGVNTNFTLLNIMELGQSNLYELKEMIPEIDVTMDKVLDGYPLLFHLATQGAGDPSLVGRSNQQSQFCMNVYSDVQQSASGTPTSEIVCSGMYFQSSSFTFPVDAPFRESMTLVGNTKTYNSSGFVYTPTYTNADAPLALAGSGGTQIRNDMIFYPIGNSSPASENSNTLDSNGQVAAFLTILPPEIGVSSSGTNDLVNGDFLAKIQNITVSCNVGRDSVLELGRKYPYFRFAQFPIPVNTEISVIALNTDTQNATEAGYNGQGDNLYNRSIRIRARDGTFIDLGLQNKLTSINWAGGDTGGGQATITYSFITYQNYTVTHPADPSWSSAWPYIS